MRKDFMCMHAHTAHVSKINQKYNKICGATYGSRDLAKINKQNC